jgi:xeroderma pigmentosum group C-complementing protein
MLPKSRGRPRKSQNYSDHSSNGARDSSLEMSARRPGGGRGKGRGNGTSSRQNLVPEVFQEMLADAAPTQSGVPERPLKKRRTGRHDDALPAVHVPSPAQLAQPLEHDEENLEFEDVPGLSKGKGVYEGSSFSEEDELHKNLQTAYRESGDESDESNDWDAFNFDTLPDEPSGDLELTLSLKPLIQRRNVTPRRKAVTKEDKALRLQIHKMHVLCLLSYMDRRNDWCNDYEVQQTLKPLLSKKMLAYLRPSPDLSQFGRAESLKRGLGDVARIWRTNFDVTRRGLRRSLWVEDEQDLQNVFLP